MMQCCHSRTAILGHYIECMTVQDSKLLPFAVITTHGDDDYNHTRASRDQFWRSWTTRIVISIHYQTNRWSWTTLTGGHQQQQQRATVYKSTSKHLICTAIKRVILEIKNYPLENNIVRCYFSILFLSILCFFLYSLTTTIRRKREMTCCLSYRSFG